jgi:hypothetical protein
MSDPERLIQDGDDFVQAMLRAAAGDGPSEASRQKVAAGFGLGGAVQGAPWRAGRPTKWMGGTLVVLALVGGAARLSRRESAPAKPHTAAAHHSAAAPPMPAPEPTPTEGVATAPPAAVPDAPVLNAPPAAVRRPLKAPVDLPKPKKKASTLDAELALLDGARASLRAGRPGDALHTLDGYDAQFATGLLVPEATVVRIEALLKMGDTAAAHSLGERFLQAHPDSPLAARVRSLTNS